MKSHTAKVICQNCGSNDTETLEGAWNDWCNACKRHFYCPPIMHNHDLEEKKLLALSDGELEAVSLGLVDAYEFTLIRSGGLYVQHLPGGEFIQLDNDETVQGVFRFCQFVDRVKS